MFQSILDGSVRALQGLGAMQAEIDRAADLMVATLKAGGKVIACGNGGSAAEAQHLTTELVGRYAKNRRALPAVALTADGSLVTCIGNDFGFNDVFARQLGALAQPQDLFVAITSSGNSPDIVAALEEARRRNLRSISLLGRGGGKCRGLATIDLIAPGDSGRTAQEAHLFLIHYFCDKIDLAFD